MNPVNDLDMGERCYYATVGSKYKECVYDGFIYPVFTFYDFETKTMISVRFDDIHFKKIIGAAPTPNYIENMRCIPLPTINGFSGGGGSWAGCYNRDGSPYTFDPYNGPVFGKTIKENNHVGYMFES